MSPALAGGLLTTGPPPSLLFFLLPFYYFSTFPIVPLKLPSLPAWNWTPFYQCLTGTHFIQGWKLQTAGAPCMKFYLRTSAYLWHSSWITENEELKVGNLYWTSRSSTYAESGGSESCSVVSDSLRPHELYSPWNSPGQNTGVGSVSLLQGIFPTPGLNPGFPNCRQILYQPSHKGSPKNTGVGSLFLL